MRILLKQSGVNDPFEISHKDSAINSASSGPFLNSPSWKMLAKDSDLDRSEIDFMLSCHFFRVRFSGVKNVLIMHNRTDGHVCIVF